MKLHEIRREITEAQNNWLYLKMFKNPSRRECSYCHKFMMINLFGYFDAKPCCDDCFKLNIARIQFVGNLV